MNYRKSLAVKREGVKACSDADTAERNKENIGKENTGSGNNAGVRRTDQA